MSSPLREVRFPYSGAHSHENIDNQPIRHHGVHDTFITRLARLNGKMRQRENGKMIQRQMIQWQNGLNIGRILNRIAFGEHSVKIRRVF